MTGDVSVLESRRAGHGAGDCALCLQPMEPGRRLAYVRRGGAHGWVHITCLIAPRAGDDDTDTPLPVARGHPLRLRSRSRRAPA